MLFTKMHGAGNDYVYVNCFAETVEDPPELARRIADRHVGVGGDGLILIRPPTRPEADCRMEMYNADGSRGRMCGNGIRCLAKYVHDRGIRAKPILRIETDAGLRTVRVQLGPDGLVEGAEVDMGPPELRRAEIPFADGGDPSQPAINVPLTVRGRQFRITAVSMGNPHAVVRMDDAANREALGSRSLQELPLTEWGPHFENHPWFPERTNTEFITVRSPRDLDFRVWERGSGETLACGTGACAAVVAGVLGGWCEREAVVHLRGGDLRIRWGAAGETPAGASVFMTGNAVEVSEGLW